MEKYQSGGSNEPLINYDEMVTFTNGMWTLKSLGIKEELFKDTTEIKNKKSDF